MVQLKVMLIGTSPAETLRMEEALHQTGFLDKFKYVGLEPNQERIPDWSDWNLLITRYQEKTRTTMFALLAPVLRAAKPPVIFLVDQFDPQLVNDLLNAGATRVIPLEQAEYLLKPCLSSLFIDFSSRPSISGPFITETHRVSPNQAAGEIQLSEPLLAQLFDASPIGIAIIRRRDRHCVDCNESLASLLESPRSELVGREILELEIPEDIRAKFDSYKPGDSALASVQFERKIYTRGRVIRHVLVHISLIDWDCEPCFFIFVQDVTERELAKDKINRSNDELERMVMVRTGALEAANRELAAEIGLRRELESFSNKLNQIIWETPDVVAICDSNWRLQFLNKAGRKLFGLGVEDSTVNLNAASAFSEVTQHWMSEEVLPILTREGIWYGESEFLLYSGQAVPLSLVLLCKKDDTGKVLYYAATARNISDLKRAEQELRQSEERYRTLAEAAHDIIFMVSKDGIMQYANGYACSVLKFNPDRVAGLSASQFFPKDFAANHLQMFTDVHEIDQPIYTEGPFTRDNEQLWLGTWLVPVHGNNGDLTSILGISRDITEQKKTDEALQRALQNERKLGEMRSNFFSMTSHQFRTPLSTILLSAELLHKYGQRWDDQKRSEHLVRIQEAARRLNGMLEDILVIGRVESGRYVVSPKEFDLIEYSSRLIYEMSVNDRGAHNFNFYHEMNDLPVYLDQEVIHRVLDNLLTNALKYSPTGSSVTVNIKREEPYILLEVTDQGIGIPERDIKYLFQPFQRASNASDIPGTGIGLTIIQKSVELMKGTISLKSKEGQGTTFMVRFPSRLDNVVDRAFA